MKNTNWIKLMSSSEFAERVKTCNTVIVPTGATEVYGPHLPLGTDTLVAAKISELVSERVNAMISPVLEVGESRSLGMFPGTLWLTPEVWTGAARDITLSLMKWGFKNFMYINGHAGNVPLVGHFVRDLQDQHGIKCAQIDWWRFVQDKAIGICDNTGWMAHGHASECGTSVMLHLYPELVDFSKAERVEAQRIGFVRDSDFVTYVPFNQTTPNGILGDATVGTAEKGKLIVQKSVDRIVEYMKTEFGC